VLTAPRSYCIVFGYYVWCLMLLRIRTSVLCYVYDIVLPLLYVLGFTQALTEMSTKTIKKKVSAE
jgi:hypothetical protein